MPRSDPSSFLPLTRRDVLLAAGAGAVSLVLPGCGGGGGHKSGSGSTQPVTVAGTVEPGSLASSSGLTVTNVYQASASVGASGEFSTMASSSGAMIHFVTDANGSLVGATLTLPGKEMIVNAESCLQASLFMTPGITIPEAATATAVIAQLKAQASYVAALAYLRANLPTTSYQTILADATYPGLLTACIKGFLPSGAKTRDVVVDPSSTGYRTVDALNIDLDTSTLKTTKITLVNAGWRYVRIDRLERDVRNVVTDATVPTGALGFNFLEGAKAYSAASLILGTVGDSFSTKDAHALDLSNVPTTEYWVQGPGWAVG